MSPARLRLLLAFLKGLGIDPTSPDGPGGTAEALAPIEEALTHTSAGRAVNHERLEFLGDAVLRLAAAEFLQHHHPRLSVGQHAALRAQLVSDRWLAGVAETCGLPAFVHLGATAAADRAGRGTVLAETAEALIGGLYQAWGGASGGLRPIHTWLTPHWQATTGELLADPDRHNWKSALQEWSQARGQGLPTYRCQEHSRLHGDPRRFRCTVSLGTGTLGEGWGGARRDAEQQAARAALQSVRSNTRESRENQEIEEVSTLRPAPGS